MPQRAAYRQRYSDSVRSLPPQQKCLSLMPDAFEACSMAYMLHHHMTCVLQAMDICGCWLSLPPGLCHFQGQDPSLQDTPGTNLSSSSAMHVVLPLLDVCHQILSLLCCDEVIGIAGPAERVEQASPLACRRLPPHVVNTPHCLTRLSVLNVCKRFPVSHLPNIL